MNRQIYDPPQFRYCFGGGAVGIDVNSGAALRCACPDSDGYCADVSPLAPDRCDRESIIDGFVGNPVVAPIAVQGAVAGDVLAVKIHSVRLNRRLGRTLVAPNHGLLQADEIFPRRVLQRQMYEWDIDVDANRATLRNPLGPGKIEVPLNPFVGCIGVAPADGRISTLYAGDHGGNLDLPCISAGATVMLPVFQRDAMISFGDIHAAQGHGEIAGGAIETSGTIDLSIQILRGRTIPGPRVIRDGSIYAVATNEDVRAACRTAAARLLEWISSESQLDSRDLYVALSQHIIFMLGNCIVSPYTAAAGIDLDALPTAAAARFREIT